MSVYTADTQTTHQYHPPTTLNTYHSLVSLATFSRPLLLPFLLPFCALLLFPPLSILLEDPACGGVHVDPPLSVGGIFWAECCVWSIVVAMSKHVHCLLVRIGVVHLSAVRVVHYCALEFNICVYLCNRSAYTKCPPASTAPTPPPPPPHTHNHTHTELESDFLTCPCLLLLFPLAFLHQTFEFQFLLQLGSSSQFLTSTNTFFFPQAL